jgi:hypothetical protein
MNMTSHASAPNTRSFSQARNALLVAALLALGACASTPLPPTVELQGAEQAIAAAEEARASEFAPLPLREARDKLTAARAAVQKEDMVQAAWLADESRVNAQLATARTAEYKAKAANDEMIKSTTTLKQEMQRNTGVAQ